MRTNFYDILAQRDFNVQKEYRTLWELFAKEHSVPINRYLKPLAEYVESAYFRQLPFRGSFISLSEMISEMGIPNFSNCIDDLLLLCEFLIAVLPEEETSRERLVQNQTETIMENINYILERTNHEIKTDANGHSIIVEKNKKSTLAAQLVDDPIVAFELIEYNHFALKGNLESKKKLLFSIAAHIEPILKSRVLQNNGFKSLESDAGFVFNNFHIRHNNKVGAKAQDYIVSIGDDELEEWYDKAYELALSVIIINDYISVGKEITQLKSQYTWRT